MPQEMNSPRDDPERYLGLTAEQAEAIAVDRGWTLVRVVPPDALVTMEYRVGRINFAADRGRVVRCWIG